jgi:hypothetical protein
MRGDDAGAPGGGRLPAPSRAAHDTEAAAVIHNWWRATARTNEAQGVAPRVEMAHFFTFNKGDWR